MLTTGFGDGQARVAVMQEQKCRPLIAGCSDNAYGMPVKIKENVVSKKKRRKKSRSVAGGGEGDFSPFLDDGYTKGTVPWSFEEMVSCLAKLEELKKTPIDDWPLEPESPSFVMEETGEQFSINQGTLAYQAFRELQARYPGPTGCYHSGRLIRFEKFMQEEKKRLCDEGWAIEDSDGFKVDPRIVRALAKLTYTKLVEVEGVKWWMFKYEDVVAAAKALPVE